MEPGDAGAGWRKWAGNAHVSAAGVVLLVFVVAVLDWKVDYRVPVGWLYLLPVSLAAARLNRVGVVALSVVCTALAEFFDGFFWLKHLELALPREALYFAAFAGVGLFVQQALQARRVAAVHVGELEGEVALRRLAEEQLQVLIESSPVAVFTADGDGRMLLANTAAGQLFALPLEELRGRRVGEFIPPLADLPALVDGVAGGEGRASFRTEMQCRGRRSTGEIFQAEVWFSTYATTSGPRLAAMVTDTSEALRDREESSLDQLLAGSRVLVGAVSHEIRNVCAAIQVVYANLQRAQAREELASGRGAVRGGTKDFEALGTLVSALERIASMELGQAAAHQPAAVDLEELLEEVLIVVHPALREQEVGLSWEIAPTLPLVWADRQSLLQVLLNLFKNSERALEGMEGERSMRLRARDGGMRIEIEVSDTGCGVEYPELLFKPFQQGAAATGLGLYLSRAMMRSFSGELRYGGRLEGGYGARFVIELMAVTGGEAHV